LLSIYYFKTNIKTKTKKIIYRTVQTAEEKRQTHILSEQKRRAQIKQGFELLKTVLPITSEKKSSKTVMIQTSNFFFFLFFHFFLLIDGQIIK